LFPYGANPVKGGSVRGTQVPSAVLSGYDRRALQNAQVNVFIDSTVT